MAVRNYTGNITSQVAHQPVLTHFSRNVTWLQGQCHYAYSSLLAMLAWIRQYSHPTWKASYTFLERHRVWVMGSLALGALGLIIQYARKNAPPPPVKKQRTEPSIAAKKENAPEYPIARLKSTLNIGELWIKVPEKKYAPLNVTLTFCIDTSSSMSTAGRIEAVQRAMKNVLENAQQVVNKSTGTKIRMAIVEFNDKPRVTIPITEIVSSTQQRSSSTGVQSIVEHINELHSKCNGGTDILAGLGGALGQLKQMIKTDQTASHTIILLTDGDNSIREDLLSEIHHELAVLSAHLFAIGIGKSHRKATLQRIIGDKESGFRGEYIDTTQSHPTIEEAIMAIYGQAISTFQNLRLRTAQLPAGSWSVEKKISISEEIHSVCPLEALQEGEARKAYIEIHGDKLQAPVDLSKVAFDLTFMDPKGQQGQVSLPWNPNTIVDPAVVRAANKKKSSS